MVEFLNGQMDPAEVPALETKQYPGLARLITLVPRQVGPTALARRRKAGAPTRHQKIYEGAFLEQMRRRRGAAEYGVAKRFSARLNGLTLGPNSNRWEKSSSFIPVVERADRPRYPKDPTQIGSRTSPGRPTESPGSTPPDQARCEKSG